MPAVLCCSSGTPSLPSLKVVALVLTIGTLIGMPIGAMFQFIFVDSEPTTEKGFNSTICAPAPLEFMESEPGSDIHASELTANKTVEVEEADDWEGNENATDMANTEEDATEKPPETTEIPLLILPTPSSRPHKPESSPPEGYGIPSIFHHLHPCTKFAFYVAPKGIGLAHIIAPHKLDLGYCAGVCTFPLMSDSVNHTLHGYFLDQLKLHEHAPYLPKTCCVPIAYKDASVIMEDNGSYVKRSLKGASVAHCGCR